MRPEAPASRGERRARLEPLPDHVVELAAERLRLVAKGTRIELLQELRGGEAGVQELADRVGLTHQNASHHLALLWRAGILARRSEGTTTVYGIADWSAWWVVEQIARSIVSPEDEEGGP